LGLTVNHIELALIELEYAKADLLAQRASMSQWSELAHVNSIVAKFAVADLALEIAIGALAEQPRIPVVKPWD
jgi:hypothetical protein